MFSAQQTRSGIPTEQQSVLPTVRGVPWWGAVLIALVPTILGAIIDGSNADGLATTYRILYFIGCVAAVLAVRRRSLFTALTQPPLIAFGVALVTLYLLKADSGSGLRQFILNVMLPIAKTFPLMAWTFVVVALLGAGRWFLTRRQTETTPRRSARHHAASTTRRSRVGARDTEKPATRRTADRRPTPRDTASRDSAPRDSASRERRTADEPTRVTTRRRTPDRAAGNPADEPSRSPRAPLSGHRRTDAADSRRTESPSPRRTGDVPPRRRDGVPPRSDGSGRRMPPRGEGDLAVPRAERDDPRADGSGRRRPPPRVRDDIPAPGERRDDLPPVPRARYRGVNP